MKILDRLFEFFQRRCRHKFDWVRADIFEGGLDNVAIQWCLRCGAWRRQSKPSGYLSPWTEPRATWTWHYLYFEHPEMTMEEAQEEYDKAPSIPLSSEQIDAMVRRVVGPEKEAKP